MPTTNSSTVLINLRNVSAEGLVKLADALRTMYGPDDARLRAIAHEEAVRRLMSDADAAIEAFAY